MCQNISRSTIVKGSNANYELKKRVSLFNEVFLENIEKMREKLKDNSGHNTYEMAKRFTDIEVKKLSVEPNGELGLVSWLGEQKIEPSTAEYFNFVLRGTKRYDIEDNSVTELGSAALDYIMLIQRSVYELLNVISYKGKPICPFAMELIRINRELSNVLILLNE